MRAVGTDLLEPVAVRIEDEGGGVAVEVGDFRGDAEGIVVGERLDERRGGTPYSPAIDVTTFPAQPLSANQGTIANANGKR